MLVELTIEGAYFSRWGAIRRQFQYLKTHWLKYHPSIAVASMITPTRPNKHAVLSRMHRIDCGSAKKEPPIPRQKEPVYRKTMTALKRASTGGWRASQIQGNEPDKKRFSNAGSIECAEISREPLREKNTAA